MLGPVVGDKIQALNLFVDEAGDPALFDSKGRILAGRENCSKTFILGKLGVNDPLALHEAFERLRVELLCDPYFKHVPSMRPDQRKTALAFHAKDDVAEVRREVFRILCALDLRFYAVVRHKSVVADWVNQRNARDPAYRYRGDELYDSMIEALFSRYLPLAQRVNICFARRGSRARTQAFRAAIQKAECRFELDYGMRRFAEIYIVASTPPQSAGLQAADYCLWALQRFYERDEKRYVELIWDKVVEIEDMDYFDGVRKGVIYNRKRPLVVEWQAGE